MKSARTKCAESSTQNGGTSRQRGVVQNGAPVLELLVHDEMLHDGNVLQTGGK